MSGVENIAISIIFINKLVVILQWTVQRCCVKGVLSATNLGYCSLYSLIIFCDVSLTVMLLLRCECVQQAVYHYDKLADRKW